MERREAPLVDLETTNRKTDHSKNKHNKTHTHTERQVTAPLPTETHLVDVGGGLDELAHHHVLSVVAGQVERGVAVGVDLVDLQPRPERDGAVAVGWRAG